MHEVNLAGLDLGCETVTVGCLGSGMFRFGDVP